MRFIGKGGFSTVYAATENGSNKRVAIKAIHRNATEEIEDAQREAYLLSQFKSPFIVKYIENFLDQDFLYIVMEMCELGDLAQMIQLTANNKKMFKEERIIDFLIELSLGLHEIHQKKILHRDIKSSNIFLTNDHTVKLGDLGLSKQLSRTNDLACTILGTPQFMSPELCLYGKYGKKNDIWSIGIVMYELMNLKLPFCAFKQQDLMRKIVNEPHQPLNTVYSQELRNLVDKMLSKNPHNRPSTEDILRNPAIEGRRNALLQRFSQYTFHISNGE
ncbi:MAG: putative protein kinase domain protein [Streblomastix strix]|uniref:non-specific serine/threonine protein kinase n=1 Tax=Streblomastix strix TaxID=222440 RepID=A0A5J4VLP5_9EUKA|nr:MAG: putative protein kinase domain protein [Streblomastix strix]